MTTDMATGQGQPIYEVFDIEPTYGATSLGGDNRIMRVHFHVVGMRDQSVDIPFAQFNAANVAARIEDFVTHLIDVRTLKGQAY